MRDFFVGPGCAFRWGRTADIKASWGSSIDFSDWTKTIRASAKIIPILKACSFLVHWNWRHSRAIIYTRCYTVPKRHEIGWSKHSLGLCLIEAESETYFKNQVQQMKNKCSQIGTIWCDSGFFLWGSRDDQHRWTVLDLDVPLARSFGVNLHHKRSFWGSDNLSALCRHSIVSCQHVLIHYITKCSASKKVKKWKTSHRAEAAKLLVTSYKDLCEPDSETSQPTKSKVHVIWKQQLPLRELEAWLETLGLL